MRVSAEEELEQIVRKRDAKSGHLPSVSPPLLANPRNEKLKSVRVAQFIPLRRKDESSVVASSFR